MANFLTEKMGPLPTWGWMAAGTAAVLLYIAYKKKSVGSNSQQQQQQAAATLAAQQAAAATVAAAGTPNYNYGSGYGYGNGWGGGARGGRNWAGSSGASSTAGNILTPGQDTSTPVTQPDTSGVTSPATGDSSSPVGNTVPVATPADNGGGVNWTNSSYAMPNVIGMSAWAATQAIMGATGGANVNVVNTSGGSGTVVSQYPAAGQPIPANGTTLSAMISTSGGIGSTTVGGVTTQNTTATVAVPNIVGMNASQATSALAAVGLALDAQNLSSSSATLRSQSPSAGTQVSRGTYVNAS